MDCSTGAAVTLSVSRRGQQSHGKDFPGLLKSDKVIWVHPAVSEHAKAGCALLPEPTPALGLCSYLLFSLFLVLFIHIILLLVRVSCHLHKDHIKIQFYELA